MKKSTKKTMRARNAKGTKLEPKGTKLEPEGTKLEEVKPATSPTSAETRPQEPSKAAPEETPAELERKTWTGAPAVYNPGVCPNCGSSRNKIGTTYPADPTTRGGANIHRIHICKNCGTHFRSMQTINAVDVPHVRVALVEEAAGA